MVEPINFNKARKARIRADAKAGAAENRIRFGRSKAQREALAAEARRAGRELDGRKRDV